MTVVGVWWSVVRSGATGFLKVSRSKGAPALPGIVHSDVPASREHSPGVGGRL
ncbi:hypothetical protein ACWEQN_43120 [Streptomyces sp. NPDC004129]